MKLIVLCANNVKNKENDITKYFFDNNYENQIETSIFLRKIGNIYTVYKEGYNLDNFEDW